MVMLTLLCFFLWSHSLRGNILSEQRSPQDISVSFRAKVLPYYNERGLLIKNLKSLDLSLVSYLHENSDPFQYLRLFKIVKDDFSEEPSFIIGGVNHVMRINGTDLTVTDFVKNGPQQDNPRCKPFPLPCNYSRELKDQQNKIIMINYESKPYPSVISCGSTSQGMCSLHNYNRFNDTQLIGDPSDPVNYVSETKDGVAVTVPSSSGTIFVLPENDSLVLDNPPVLSSKILTGDTGKLTFRRVKNQTFPFKRRYWRPLYGFHDQEYAYFIINEDTGTSVMSKLLRSSLNMSVSSYAELDMGCSFHSEKSDYAQSAFFGEISENHDTSSSSDFSTRTLYVSFKKLGKSVICGFSMGMIRQKFNNWSKNCNITTDQSKSETVCYNNYTPIPLTTVPLLVWEKKIIALAIDVQRKNTVALFVDKSGNIVKALLGYQGIQGQVGQVLYKWKLSSADHVFLMKEIVMSKEGNETYAYIGARNLLTKFPVNSCSIYKTCRACLTSGDPLKCGWCGNSCSKKSECTDQFNRNSCPILIRSFSPTKGPQAGGTELLIEGDYFKPSNNTHNFNENRSKVLGFKLNSDLDFVVKVVDTACNITEFQMDKIRCVTEASSRAASGIIQVMHKTKSQTIRSCNSTLKFQFMNPNITAVNPTHGPKSGGTTITLNGTDLDIGKRVTVSLGKTNCKITEVSSSTILCVTEPWKLESEELAHRVTVSIDDQVIKTGFQFNFLEGPMIYSIEPRGAVCSGRNPITVHGESLDQILKPYLKVVFNGSFNFGTYWKDCQVQTSNNMTCFTPSCPSNFTEMDNPPKLDSWHVTASLIINETVVPRFKNFVINYHPDPEFFDFGNITQEISWYNPILEIEGKNINVDYKIWISVGSFPCDVVDHQTNKLWCRTVFGEKQPVEGGTLPLGIKIRLEDQYQYLGDVIIVDKSKQEQFWNYLVNYQYYVIAIIIVFAGVFIGTVLCCCKKKKEHQLKISVKEELASQRNSVYDEWNKSNIRNEYHETQDQSQIPLMAIQQSSMTSFHLDDESFARLQEGNKIISKDRLTLGDYVGKGNFGFVYKADLYHSDRDDSEEVAVKTLQMIAATQNDFDIFIQEALIMKDFCHPRVLHLIGVSFLDNMTPLVVTPFMANGDLLAFLRDDNKNPTVSDLIAFAIEIAEGMEYLASLKFVHRDLAARNCLLDKENHVKIADFGLSRDVYEKDYYRPEQRGALPMKWMAPESLEEDKFTTMSDVWSFGVTFWEIITRGIPPYHNVPNFDIIDYLKTGKRLGKPDHCPISFYELMKQCWSWNPEERPTFSDILTVIHSSVKKIDRKNTSRQLLRNQIYVNVFIASE